jgi:hypothetical protein
MRRQAEGRAVKVLAVLFVLATGSGCSKSLPTSPISVDPMAQHRAPVATSSTGNYTWSTVASKWVNKTDDVTVAGGRVSVKFVRGSLTAGAQVVIQQRDAALADFIVGPLGTVCGSKQPTVTVDYAGSNADASSMGIALVPKLWKLNEATGMWEQVPGTVDLTAKKMTAKVSVLCRYGLSFDSPGKGGW